HPGAGMAPARGALTAGDGTRTGRTAAHRRGPAPERRQRVGPSEAERARPRARAFEASTSRSRGGALVTRVVRSCRAARVTWSRARSKATAFARDGRVNPLSFRTNCRDEAWISASVAGGSKLCSVLMLRHMAVLRPPRGRDASLSPSARLHGLDLR